MLNGYPPEYAVISEAYHLIRHIAKELVMCSNADEEVL